METSKILQSSMSNFTDSPVNLEQYKCSLNFNDIKHIAGLVPLKQDLHIHLYLLPKKG